MAATLPDTPVNTAITIGVVAGLTLIGYTQTLRAKIDGKVHDNYREFKAMDTELIAHGKPTLSTERSVRPA